MQNEIIEAIKSGLKGKFIHSDPLIIIKGLTPEIARKKPNNFDHSCWDLLYHTVIWDEIFLRNIKGEIVNWSPENNFPDEKEKEIDQNFNELVIKFESDLQEIRDLLEFNDIDFSINRKLTPDRDFELSIIKLYITTLQHISYHMGQIACVRKMVDNWPMT